MKVLMKILLGLVAVGGVCYWLLSKFALPAKRLHERRRFRQLQAEELIDPQPERKSDEPRV